MKKQKITEDEKNTITSDDMTVLRELLQNVKGLSLVSEAIPVEPDQKVSDK